MDFSSFLSKKLKEKKIDVEVYHGYISGILEDTIDDDEKREMITDILSSLIEESEVDGLTSEIFEKWTESHSAPKKPVVVPRSQIDIAQMLKSQTEIAQQASSHQNRHLTEEEKRIKEQILASYSQTSDKEEDDDSSDSGCSDDPDLEKNTNKADVQKLAKEKREQAKLESQQKKIKDKEDRAKQKASRDEKKAKRQSAAVKGERKR